MCNVLALKQDLSFSFVYLSILIIAILYNVDEAADGNGAADDDDDYAVADGDGNDDKNNMMMVIVTM